MEEQKPTLVFDLFPSQSAFWVSFEGWYQHVGRRRCLWGTWILYFHLHVMPGSSSSCDLFAILNVLPSRLKFRAVTWCGSKLFVHMMLIKQLQVLKKFLEALKGGMKGPGSQTVQVQLMFEEGRGVMELRVFFVFGSVVSGISGRYRLHNSSEAFSTSCRLVPYKGSFTSLHIHLFI